ncbi:MAG: DUF4153 domain-containing protein [Bacteroidales bacterium]|nr:DUF4153 domain-containing protein [Bacteroidales bacterium]
MNIISSIKKISPKELLQIGKETACRFPLSCISAIILTIVCLLLVHSIIPTIKDNYILLFFLLFYPATTYFLNILTKLLAEKYTNRKLLIICGINIFWFAFSIIASLYWWTNWNVIGIVAACLLMLVLLFCYPTLIQKDNLTSWKFATQNIANLAVIGFTLLIFYGALCLLYVGTESLFNIKINGNLFLDTLIVCFCAIMPFLFLTQISTKQEDANNLIQVAQYVSYLLIPVQLLYVIVLYVYAAKILFTWTLPCGTVSWMVTASMIGMILLQWILYPKMLDKKKTVKQTILRYLPILMIPLLILMSVGIGRRISDYGITISRLYVLIANIWFYGICIYLIITRSKDIIGIPISFAIGFLLISFGPISVPNITLRILTNEVKTLLADENISYPITNEQAITITNTKAIDKLQYIQHTYKNEDYQDIIDEYIYFGIVDTTYSADSPKTETIITNSSKKLSDISYYFTKNNWESNLPLEQYNKLQKITNNYFTISDSQLKTDSITFTVGKTVVTFPIEAIEKQNNNDIFTYKTDSVFLILTSFSLRIKGNDNNEIRFNGILLTK